MKNHDLLIDSPVKTLLNSNKKKLQHESYFPDINDNKQRVFSLDARELPKNKQKRIDQLIPLIQITQSTSPAFTKTTMNTGTKPSF